MSAFDFTGDFPRWEDADERLYEARRAEAGFVALVDQLMACDGMDKEEAEEEALRRLTAGASSEGEFVDARTPRFASGHIASAAPAASLCDPGDCACGECGA